MHKFACKALGSGLEITIWDKLEEEVYANLQTEILKKTEEFESLYSRFKENSLVWQLAGKTGLFAVPAEFIEILNIYRKLYLATSKKFTPLIGYTISDLGYDINYSLKPKDVIRATPDFNSAIEIFGSSIKINEPLLFDLGGIGKGFLVDKIASFLQERGLEQFLVNGSGDIFYYSKKREDISAGLEHPQNNTKIIGLIKLKAGAFCASGINRRAWGNKNHVINPLTNNSVSGDIIASWVKAEKTYMADALATCLFLVEPEQLAKYFDFEYCLLDKSLIARQSDNFNAELY